MTKTNSDNFVNKSKSIFDQDELLCAYDRILPLADHYKSIIEIHLRELESCEHVIDLGCGTGIPTLEFLKRGQRVTAVDISLRSLDILRMKAEEAGCSSYLTILHADINDLSCVRDNQFDGASSMIVAHLLENPAAHFSECLRVLKPHCPLVLTARIRNGRSELLADSTFHSIQWRPDYQSLTEDFLLIKKNLLLTAPTRSKSCFSRQEFLKLLLREGFENTMLIENRTLEVMMSSTAFTR